MVTVARPHHLAHHCRVDPGLNPLGGPGHLLGPPNWLGLWFAPPQFAPEAANLVPDHGDAQVSQLQVGHTIQVLAESRKHHTILKRHKTNNVNKF